jgi:hypothetical protein
VLSAIERAKISGKLPRNLRKGSIPHSAPPSARRELVLRIFQSPV